MWFLMLILWPSSIVGSVNDVQVNKEFVFGKSFPDFKQYPFAHLYERSKCKPSFARHHLVGKHYLASIKFNSSVSIGSVHIAFFI